MTSGCIQAALGPLTGYLAGMLLWIGNVLACGGMRLVRLATILKLCSMAAGTAWRRRGGRTSELPVAANGSDHRHCEHAGRNCLNFTGRDHRLVRPHQCMRRRLLATGTSGRRASVNRSAYGTSAAASALCRVLQLNDHHFNWSFADVDILMLRSGCIGRQPIGLSGLPLVVFTFAGILEDFHRPASQRDDYAGMFMSMER